MVSGAVGSGAPLSVIWGPPDCSPVSSPVPSVPHARARRTLSLAELLRTPLRRSSGSAPNPHSLLPIGQDHRPGDAHILGYYVRCSTSEISELELDVSSEARGEHG